MKYLISGASGFLGKAFIEQLTGEKLGLSRSEKQGLFQLDLSDDELVEDFIAKHQNDKFDNFLHCAGVTPWEKEPNYKDDTLISKNVVKICATLKIKKLFFMSGWVVYAIDNKVPITEEARVNPTSDYGRSKLLQENFYLSELEKTDTKVINLRLSSIYGPNQHSPGLIKNLTQGALLKSVLMLSTTKVKRDYLYIDDLVEIIEKLTGHEFTHSINLNISSGRSRSVLEVAECVVSAVRTVRGTQAKILISESLPNASPLDNELDISMLRSMIDIDFTEFQVGITEYIRWYSGVYNENRT